MEQHGEIEEFCVCPHASTRRRGLLTICQEMSNLIALWTDDDWSLVLLGKADRRRHDQN